LKEIDQILWTSSVPSSFKSACLRHAKRYDQQEQPSSRNHNGDGTTSSSSRQNQPQHQLLQKQSDFQSPARKETLFDEQSVDSNSRKRKIVEILDS
jgi:aromatic ring hydroxylase